MDTSCLTCAFSGKGLGSPGRNYRFTPLYGEHFALAGQLTHTWCAHANEEPAHMGKLGSCTVPIACTRCLANHVTLVAQRIRCIHAPKRFNAFLLLAAKSIPKGPNMPPVCAEAQKNFSLVEHEGRIYLFTVYTLQVFTPHFVFAS